MRIKYALMADELNRLLTVLPVKSEWAVLDIGCGPIRPYSFILTDKFRKCFGFDYNLKILKGQTFDTCRKHGVHIFQGNIEKMAFRNGSFDLVICNDMLAYTNKKKSLSEIYRVLRQGGYCISLFNNTSAYSWYKIFHPFKFYPIEVIHSCLVLINTVIFMKFNKRFFHTTFNTNHELKSLIDTLPVNKSDLWIDKNFTDYPVLNFIFQK